VIKARGLMAEGTGEPCFSCAGLTGENDLLLCLHLGYNEGESAPPSQSNRRNGTSTKVLKGQDGEMPVAVPRDRISPLRQVLIIRGRGNRQDSADRLDPMLHAMRVDGMTPSLRPAAEFRHRKKADALRRISFA